MFRYWRNKLLVIMNECRVGCILLIKCMFRPLLLTERCFNLLLILGFIIATLYASVTIRHWRYYDFGLFFRACVPRKSASVNNIFHEPYGRMSSNLQVRCTYAVVTCEIQLFWNNFKIISVFYFTRNHVWDWNKIILAAEKVLKLFQNYFSDNEQVGKYSWAAVRLWNNVEIISGKFLRAEIKLCQTDVDEG